ncbi:MAG: 5'/3'-nucleotidase SurE [Rickettsiales bacterium]|nr:5'/3'-nucleotidase SurE [Rickettsiales bacterium]
MTIDLKTARILISNDDGVNAEGLALLERVARTLSDDVWVVAPEQEQSGAGHSLSLHKPLRVRELGKQRFAVDGTPTDAVLVGVMEVLKDKRPDLMLSGINRGSNLAEDVTYSGTVSAAMEATLLEIPSIAFSNQIKCAVNWAVPEHYIVQLIRSLAQTPIAHDRLLNVNFPAVALAEVKGIRVCPQGRRKLDDNLDRRTDPQGRPYIWIGGQRTEPFKNPEESDFTMIAAGYITVTPLSLDMTDYTAMKALKAAIGE